MKATTWSKASALVALVAVPAARAQTPACKINDSSPYQLGGAKQYVQFAAAAKRPDEVPKHLQNATKVLTESPEKINNEAGRQYLLVRTYAQWLQQPDAKYVVRRGDIGLPGNPDGQQNLLLAIDSAARSIEGLMPQCRETIQPYRQKFLGEIMNKAVTALNAEKLDSAAYYANTSLMVASSDPRPWNVLAAVYQKQSKMDSAMVAMDRVISLSGADTTYARVRQQSRYNLAVLTLQGSERQQGDQKSASIAKSRGLLESFLKEAPGDPSATQALARAMRMSGDTSAVNAVFADMLKSPEKFTDIQLFEAGSNAASARQDAEAVQLFQAGLAKNPYHRVALLNLANTLYQLKDTEKMGPVVGRLTQVDPNSDNAWKLTAGYWQLRARNESDAAKKKVYNDSVLFYIDRQQKLSPRVDVSNAQRSGNSFQVEGSVQNDGAAAGNYTLKFEFLDPAGTVVATKDVAVGEVAPKGTAAFNVKVDAPKAVAFRYAPLK